MAPSRPLRGPAPLRSIRAAQIAPVDIATNNRWENLREVTRTENNRNKCNRSDNTSGHPGITWLPRNKKWRARINTGAQRISLGLFSSLDQAIAARKEAEAKLGYQPSHGRRAAA